MCQKWRKSPRMLRRHEEKKKMENFMNWPNCCRCPRPSHLSWTKRQSSDWPQVTWKWEPCFLTVSYSSIGHGFPALPDGICLWFAVHRIISQCLLISLSCFYLWCFTKFILIWTFSMTDYFNFIKLILKHFKLLKIIIIIINSCLFTR